jgi:hypothetical protein
MSVAKKQRRKLMRDDREFIWWVALDYDSNDMILHIVSDDKKFMAHYVLGQQDQERLVIILGPEFSGATTGGSWQRFRCPCFDPHGVATPSGVRKLIDWCLAGDEVRAPLSWGEHPWASYGSPPDVAGFLGQRVNSTVVTSHE